MGWGDLDDGPLLDVMAGRFDVLVTVDKRSGNGDKPRFWIAPHSI